MQLEMLEKHQAFIDIRVALRLMESYDQIPMPRYITMFIFLGQISIVQWEIFRIQQMEVLYLIYGRYPHFRILEWPLTLLFILGKLSVTMKPCAQSSTVFSGQFIHLVWATLWMVAKSRSSW